MLAFACLGVWLSLLLTGWAPFWVSMVFLLLALVVYPWRQG